MSEKVGVDIALHMYEIENDLLLKHGVNLRARTIQLVGPICDETFVRIDTALALLEEKSGKSITLKINSDGGSTYDALAIVSRMKASKCKITTEAYGACMSAATIILAAGDKRRISSVAMLMHHEAAYGLEGTHTQIMHNVAQAEREEHMWNALMEKYTGTDASTWAEKGKLGKDWYLNAEECLALGVVDEIF